MEDTWNYLEGQTDHLNFDTPNLTAHFSPCTLVGYFPYLCMIFPIIVYDFSQTSVWKHASVWNTAKISDRNSFRTIPNHSNIYDRGCQYKSEKSFQSRLLKIV